MKQSTVTRIALLISALTGVMATMASAQAEYWSEDFTGFESGVQYFAGVGVYTFGFDGEDEAVFDSNTTGGNNVKPLNSGEWAKAGGLTTAFGFNDIGGGNIVAQPSAIGVNASKGMGVFLSSSAVSMPTGTYAVSFDIIGDGAEERNARIWVGTSSTHDMTVANGWGIDLSDVVLADGNVGSPWLLTGAASISSVVSGNLVTATSGSYKINFDYVAGEDIAIVIATANTDAAFDNFKITDEIAAAQWGGFDIDDLGIVDTGSWMGLLYVENDPWVWSYSFEDWIYLPESHVVAGGAWGYVSK